jgi:hypothetical protein
MKEVNTTLGTLFVSGSIATNVFGLGEVAEPDAQ